MVKENPTLQRLVQSQRSYFENLNPIPQRALSDHVRSNEIGSKIWDTRCGRRRGRGNAINDATTEAYSAVQKARLFNIVYNIMKEWVCDDNNATLGPDAGRTSLRNAFMSDIMIYYTKKRYCYRHRDWRPPIYIAVCGRLQVR